MEKLDEKNQSKSYRRAVLLLLTLIYAFNFIDRQIIGILSPFIKEDLGLTNTQLGYLKGFYFALFYTVVGIPIAWLADRYSRVNILSLSLAVWSGFTALTGIATNFASIGAARMGVGVGEAGGSPASHSIISDLYSKEERAKALAVYSIGLPVGIGAAYFLAGLLLSSSGAAIGWRKLLIILGITGILLAIFTKFFIKEPERGQQEKTRKDVLNAPFKKALKTLLSIPSWWAMCLGIAFASFSAYAVSAWQVDYLLPFDRSQETPYGFRKMMYLLAFLNCVIYGAGTYLGGAFTQRLAKTSIRAYGLVPALAIGLCLPLVILAFWAPTVQLHLMFITFLLFFKGVYLGPSFAIAQTLAPINMRAMSTALFFLVLNLIALGGGPTAAGYLVDYFEPAHGNVHAIRLAVTLTGGALALSALCFLTVAITLPKDWAAAQARNEG